MSVLYNELSDFYELIIQKDTDQEVNFLKKYLEDGTVLDLACGNGRHACPLSEAGYDVLGIDSSSRMINKACEKCSKPEFRKEDIRDFELGQKFQNAILMWSTINLFGREDVQKIMDNVCEHLQVSGLFILDTKKYPGDGEVTDSYEVENGDVKIRNTVERKYSDRSRKSKYRYQVHYKDSGNEKEFEDTEKSNYYKKSRLKEIGRSAGFKLEKLITSYSGSKGDRQIYLFRKNKS